MILGQPHSFAWAANLYESIGIPFFVALDNGFCCISQCLINFCSIPRQWSKMVMWLYKTTLYLCALQVKLEECFDHFVSNNINGVRLLVSASLPLSLSLSLFLSLSLSAYLFNIVTIDTYIHTNHSWWVLSIIWYWSSLSINFLQQLTSEDVTMMPGCQNNEKKKK